MFQEELKLDEIDFKWVDNCDNQAKLQEAIKLIEDDGDYFPDLKNAIKKKLQKIAPNFSKENLTSQIPKEEKNQVINNLENWSKNIPQQVNVNKQKHEAEDLKIKGDEALKSGDYQESINFYNKAIELNSNNELIYGNQAFAYTQLKKYKEAIESASQAININNKYVKGYYRRAKANESLKNYQSAYQDVLEILKLEPSNTVALKMKEQFKKQIPEDQLRNIKQNDDIYQQQNGKMKIQIEEQSDESDDDEDDEQSKILNKKQKCADLIQKGNFDEAIQIFESYVSQKNIQDNYQEIWLASMCNLSHCYKQQQDDDSAIKICNEIIQYFIQQQNEPDSKQIGMLVKTILRKAFSLERKEQIKLSLQEFLLAQKFQPYNPQVNQGVQRNITTIKSYDDQFDLDQLKRVVDNKYKSFKFINLNKSSYQPVEIQPQKQEQNVIKENKQQRQVDVEQENVNMSGLELDKLIELKNDGNNSFKNKNYKQAINYYTKAIKYFDKINDVKNLNLSNQKVLTDLLSNRSLSYFYYQQYQKGIYDIQRVLDITPDNYKAMYRMTLNCEGLTNELFSKAQNAVENKMKLDFYQQTIKNAQQTIKYAQEVLNKESNSKLEICQQKANQILQQCQQDISKIQQELNQKKEEIQKETQQNTEPQQTQKEIKNENNVKENKMTSKIQSKQQLNKDFQEKALKIAQQGRLSLLENYKEPTTSSQFETELKSFNEQNDLAYQYIIKTRSELIKRFYQNNQIESTTLLNIFKVIDSNIKNEKEQQNFQKIHKICEILPDGKKFKLSIMMLLKKEKLIIKNVIENLGDQLSLSEQDVDALKQSYKIKQL